MKLGFSQEQIIDTAKSLGLPTDGFVQRRVARAIDILESNKVNEIDDGIFRVHSQYDEGKSYIVNVNSGDPSCDCPDGERTINCKHRIASLLYLRQAQAKQAAEWNAVPSSAKALTIYDDTANSYLGRGRWIVTDHIAKIRYQIYRDSKGGLHCPCERGRKRKDCEHKKAVRKYLNNNGGGIGRCSGIELPYGSKITNDCGSERAKQLQDKLNSQLNKSGNNGNGAYCAPSQPMQLDISDPFQEAEFYDIEQIEGRRDGELVWKLSNGEYVISYAGVMKLAEKHDIDFPTIIKSKQAVIAYAQTNGSMRLSGKPVRTYDNSIETVCELAKRNAARQLLPLPEIKAIEKKVQLEAEFSWEVAYEKCKKLVGGKAQCDCVITDLVKAGKLRQDNPSHYDRTEWLIIHDACKKDAESNDGGDNPPSSLLADGTAANDDEWKVKLQECEDAAANEVRYCWIRSDLEREGILPKHPKDWQDSDFETLKPACALDASLFNRGIGDDWTLVLETNKGVWAYERRYRFWIVTKDTNELREKCFNCGKTRSKSQLSDDLIHWERYYIKTVVCADCLKETTKVDMTKRFDELYHNGNGAVNTDGLPKPSEDFINQIDSVLGKFDTAWLSDGTNLPVPPATNKRGSNAWLSDGTNLPVPPSERTQELPNNADDFVSECKEAVDNADDDNTVEANEQPLEGDNGKRKLQMDKKLKTWLIEADGTKKAISCREICEQFSDGSIVTRLRAGIDSGADISTVEID